MRHLIFIKSRIEEIYFVRLPALSFRSLASCNKYFSLSSNSTLRFVPMEPEPLISSIRSVTVPGELGSPNPNPHPWLAAGMCPNHPTVNDLGPICPYGPRTIDESINHKCHDPRKIRVQESQSPTHGWRQGCVRNIRLSNILIITYHNPIYTTSH